MSVAQGKEELELHTIAIDDGIGKASRTFGIGEYASKVETIPPEFSAIGQELKQLKAFPPSEKNLRFAAKQTGMPHEEKQHRYNHRCLPKMKVRN